MATTRKPRPRKVAASEPVAAKTKVDEPKATGEPIVSPSPEVAAPEVDVPREVDRKVPPRAEPEPRERIFTIHLTQGSRYSSRGINFVAGRPLVTSDVKLYEVFRFNGRLRIDVREGGAE